MQRCSVQCRKNIDNVDLIKHVRLILNKLVPDCLEMQPADVITANMFTAISRTVGADLDRCDPRCCDIELLFATPFERNEPLLVIFWG